MSRTLTTIKKGFYKFKNKVDLTNREVFGYSADVDERNNELYVYLNKSLDNSESKSITNYNLGGNDIHDTIRLFWDDRLRSSNVYRFKDYSIYTDKVQPILTDYFQYRGNIFEFKERMEQFVKSKISREQEVKKKYLDWFDVDFLTEEGMKRISRYIFNLEKYSNEPINNKYIISNSDLTYEFNEYFRIQTNVDLDDKEMFVLANSNSIRPAAIYYKKVKTQLGTNLFENKFIFPLYLGKGISDLTTIFGLTVLRGIHASEITGNKVMQAKMDN